MIEQYTFTATKTGRDVTFHGTLLGESSTHVAGKPRWSELMLFRTAHGKYIVVKIGRSLMMHADRACGRSGNLYVKHRIDDVDSFARVPCSKCLAGASGVDSVYFENDLTTVVVLTDADAAVDAVHLVDDDGVVFLPYIAQNVLSDAAGNDPDIRKAYAEVVA